MAVTKLRWALYLPSATYSTEGVSPLFPPRLYHKHSFHPQAFTAQAEPARVTPAAMHHQIHFLHQDKVCIRAENILRNGIILRM